jgi:NADH-quinone oxidoreductase subunit E
MAKLSEKTQARIRSLTSRFPHKRSAVIPALHYAQAEIGFLDEETLVEIAGILDLPKNMTTEAVSFYTMFNREKKGQYKIEICRNLGCALMGNLEMLQFLEERLGIKRGETTSDGKFTLVTAECLGACGYAPMMQIGSCYYELLDREKVEAIFQALARDEIPPVAPAGYFDRDQEKPVKGEKTAVPTYSEGIRENLYLGGPEAEKEAVE